MFTLEELDLLHEAAICYKSLNRKIISISINKTEKGKVRKENRKLNIIIKKILDLKFAK